MDIIVQARWNNWLSQQLEDADLAEELQAMKGNEKKIEDCFYKELEFGTGGLRGVIGAGTNRMNIYTVAKATQGYADYLNGNFQSPTVAIAHDSRIKSDRFAEVAAEVLAANGIRVYTYPELMPTPALSFAVRSLGCSGGIVITASHNPAKYNGYKVYGADGCQITTEAAKAILTKINTVDVFRDVKRISFARGTEQKIISYIGEETVKAFIQAVSAQSLCGDENIDKSLSIVYTPLNGTGLKCVTRCLQENGFMNISVVKDQAEPDGNFPTCPYPNPEIREALEVGLKEARRLGSELLLATDPDCDRAGIAVKSENDYVLLSGNEVGMLLLDYICKRRLALKRMPENPIVIKTIVTIDMAKRIAADYGVQVIDVLTGFKFIGEQIGLLEKKGEADRFILGFEESYGYLTGSYVRDKDAVNASLMICEMFAYYKARGKSLLEVLNGLYTKYGYCLNTLHSYEFEGASGFRKMQNIMERLRNECPETWAGYEIVSVSDYQKSVTRYRDGGEIKIDLPVSNVLKFEFEDNISVVVRPSGTEPKLKTYISVSAGSREEAGDLEKRFVRKLDAMFV